jgi:GrpB-like predicted nucleotidyltransferase (UPF0157 family)
MAVKREDAEATPSALSAAPSGSKRTLPVEDENSRNPSRVPAPLTEDQIIAATVGPLRPLNSTIYLAPPDPAWASLFLRLRQQIQEALGDDMLLLEHVGSTSIPGLSAKPIIDMVLAVADSSNERAYIRPLEEKGYALTIREPDWYEHRLLKPAEVPGNLHVFSRGCEEIDRMLLFRDWLRNHADDRWLYESTKRELAARTWKYTQNHADAKGAVIRAILARARSTLS